MQPATGDFISASESTESAPETATHVISSKSTESAPEIATQVLSSKSTESAPEVDVEPDSQGSVISVSESTVSAVEGTSSSTEPVKSKLRQHVPPVSIVILSHVYVTHRQDNLHCVHEKTVPLDNVR